MNRICIFCRMFWQNSRGEWHIINEAVLEMIHKKGMQSGCCDVCRFQVAIDIKSLQPTITDRGDIVFPH